MKIKIGIIGLGYVGLPLAVEFSKKYPTIGFDINKKRINELMSNRDVTKEIEDSILKKVIAKSINKIEEKGNGLYCTSKIKDIKNANFYIITVPTPVDKNKKPILTLLFEATESVAKFLRKGDYIVYESTVYPGVTEEECVPILEKISNLKLNEDFFVGYSPERINPGDKEHTITKILKITSGSNTIAAKKIDKIYKSIINAGTYLAPSIKVAEAAKVIENSQRDINIAFVNELAKIFNKLNIDTNDVLKAAETKWNFLSFKPGLVGGHCIGVDPYYLAQKAQKTGYNPEIILGGRRLNDSMGKFVSSQIIKLMRKNNIDIISSNVLMLGITFKENCPDIRNTGAINVYKELSSFKIKVDVFDTWAEPNDVKKTYNINLIKEIKKKYHAIILVVNHNSFQKINIQKHLASNGIIYDIKGALPREIVTGRL